MEESSEFLYEGDKMVCKPVRYIPKVRCILDSFFDEILLYAAGNKQRDEKMDLVKVDIDVGKNMISVYTNGDGGLSNLLDFPWLFYGFRLRHSDNRENLKGNRGFLLDNLGELAEVFRPTGLVIQMSDAKTREMDQQPYFSSMVQMVRQMVLQKGFQSCTFEFMASENGTKVTFVPDLAEFNTTLEDDVIALMKKKVVDLAGYLGKPVKVELNGEQIAVKSFLDYVNLHLQSASSINRPDTLPRKPEVVNDGPDGETNNIRFVGARKSCEPKEQKAITYMDFVNQKHNHFTIADLQRVIPSMVDGLTSVERKILFCFFKCNSIEAVSVVSVYVSPHCTFHGESEKTIVDTIFRMAQNFVGSNNINLLQPHGQFGTRRQGGTDHGSAWSAFTNLSPITRFLFPKDDDILLDYLNEGGQSFEPTWYVPVIPTVLVNGSEGIGFNGLGTFIPNYDPKDIVANLRRLMKGESMVPMKPWYRGFKGTIEKSMEGVYIVNGVIVKDKETLWISELPIRSWTQGYEGFLESMRNDGAKELFIKDYIVHYDCTDVLFEIIMSKDMTVYPEEKILEKFGLTQTIKTDNMHLFDQNGAIKKYDNPEKILEDFYDIRLPFYIERKRVLVGNLESRIQKLKNKLQIIKDPEGFTRNEFDALSKPDYEDLLSSFTDSQTNLNLQDLLSKEILKLENEMESLESVEVISLWEEDLKSLEKKVDEQCEIDLKAKMAMQMRNSKVMKDAAKEATSSLKFVNENEVAKRRGEEGPQEAPVLKKYKPAAEDTEDSEDFEDSSTDEDTIKAILRAADVDLSGTDSSDTE